MMTVNTGGDGMQDGWQDRTGGTFSGDYYQDGDVRSNKISITEIFM